MWKTSISVIDHLDTLIWSTWLLCSRSFWWKHFCCSMEELRCRRINSKNVCHTLFQLWLIRSDNLPFECNAIERIVNSWFTETNVDSTFKTAFYISSLCQRQTKNILDKASRHVFPVLVKTIKLKEYLFLSWEAAEKIKDIDQSLCLWS